MAGTPLNYTLCDSPTVFEQALHHLSHSTFLILDCEGNTLGRAGGQRRGEDDRSTELSMESECNTIVICQDQRIDTVRQECHLPLAVEVMLVRIRLLDRLFPRLFKVNRKDDVPIFPNS